MARLLTLFPLFTLLLALSWPAQSSPFKACEPYDAYIEQSVKKHWPNDFYRPLAFRAQLYQESLCNPNAVSPVGATGIAQFMPATWREMQGIFKSDYKPTDAHIAIDYGAYYQARQMRVWRRRGRTYEEQWELGLAGYNAGTGNILKAQSKCGGAKLWDGVSQCLSMVTGRHSAETITYVSRIKRWRVNMRAEQVHYQCMH